MKENPLAYIPMDRRQALAAGRDLPDRAEGSSLFADISGFTPLTEALVNELGRQRGAEELTRVLNLVYDALIHELHRFGGSAIAFAGDAITCWFDGDDGRRATASALAMQQAMTRFESVRTPHGATVALRMKASVAVGSVRRFVVGDPDIRLIDALAGSTLERLAAGEHLANKGEVVVDDAVLQHAGQAFELLDLRSDDRTRRFGVVDRLLEPVSDAPWPLLAADALEPTEVRRWLLPSVHALLQQGTSEFLAELRPTVALFLRFDGIDYDADANAGDKLDAWVRWIQHVLERYQGTLIDLNIGDKGSYIYINFGAPIAHEDNALRAALAALDLREMPAELHFIQPLQIGISQGRMRAGAYGGSQHRTYGVLGDSVNMAARLMMKADPGQIVVHPDVHAVIEERFAWRELPEMRVKGKSEPVKPWALEGVQRRAVLHQPRAAQTPMVGRRAEFERILEHLGAARRGRGQVVSIVGNAGLGKSRLVAEAAHVAREEGFDVHGGECESYGVNTRYLVWQPIWRSLLGIDADWEVQHQIAALEARIARMDPGLVRRVPLLGTLLSLPIPDNELTQTFDAKLRKASLESMLSDCMHHLASEQPLVLVLEDCHWLDPLSYDLLEVIARAIANLPVLLLLAYRPLELERLRQRRISVLPYHVAIDLSEMSTDDLVQLTRMRLGALPVARAELAFPQNVVQRIVQQAEGNPFYVEELVKFIRYNGIDPYDPHGLDHLELPSSLQQLVLSRMDQIQDNAKTTLKVASIVGRTFRAPWLWGIYPELGAPATVRDNLEYLTVQEMIESEPAEPIESYDFKHVITHDVVYATLLHAMRAALHERVGHYIETTFAERLSAWVDLLAFHYDLSENIDKRCMWLRAAGEAAQAAYANDAAIDYYRRALPLLTRDARIDVMLHLGEVLRVVGQWDDVAEVYRGALELAQSSGDARIQARCHSAVGEFLRLKGDYPHAWEHLVEARALYESVDDKAGAAQVLHTGGTLAAQQGEYDLARARYAESLEMRRALGDRDGEARLLNNLAIMAVYQADLATALNLHEASLEIRREVGDRFTIANSLSNLGDVLRSLGEFAAARARLEEAVALEREIGNRWGLANALNNLGNAARAQGDYAEAHQLYIESISIYRLLGDRWALAYLLEDLGTLAALQREDARAVTLVSAANALRSEIGSPLPPAEQAKLDAEIAHAVEDLGEEAAEAARARGCAMRLDEALEYALGAAS